MVCETATKGRGNPCSSHQLRETTLRGIIMSQLAISDWDDEAVIEQVERIDASPDWLLTIVFRDGRRITVDYRTGQEGDD